MPYINNEDREKYNKLIGEIVEVIKPGCGGNDLKAGELNYVISRIVWDIFKKFPSYTLGNSLMGVIECVKQEFYRRQLGIYEDVKIIENGDI